MKLCWRILCLEDIRLSLTQLVSARDVVQTILKLENDRRMEVFFLLWVWWYARNKVNSGEDVIRVEEVVHKVKQLICDHASLRKGKHPKVNVQRNKWVPPVDGNLKLNFDGAFRAVNKSGGYDFLVRDHRGCAVLAGAGCLEHVHDAFAAEAEAGLAGLKSAISHGFDQNQQCHRGEDPIWEENSLNILVEFMLGRSIQSFLGRVGPFHEAVIRKYAKHILHGQEEHSTDKKEMQDK
ncbi:hypothetical protein OsJ_04898 [Oryza sativa Japonica Group]|uniref:RNase H type-1 domain-containing protein n=1 Tax=Oryza sativa subsp. japonica TaxID=39947 RepID=B9EWX9_ORYSJ|nr:hypothetical protein OsJ_04898 [Oryza sativa Japonica Group]